MRIVKLSPEAFDKYISSISYCSYFQTSAYGHLLTKFGLKEEYIGFEEKGQLVGAVLLLHKPIFMGFKYAYAPRGIIIDYNNQNLVYKAMKELKAQLLKNHFLMLKMDPLIICSKRNKKGEIIGKNPNIKQIITTLKKVGFTHCGFNSYFESVKPRWEAELDLRNDTNTLFKNLSKQTRNKLRKATKYGLSIYKDNKYNFSQIYHLIKEKDNVSLKYYEQMHNSFGENCELYYAKLNTRVYVENSKYLYEKEVEINDYLTNIIQSNGYKGKDMSSVLNKKMESDKLLSAYKKYMIMATKLLKEHPDGLIVGATIIVKNKNKIFLIVEGFDKNYKNLSANYLTKWKIIEKYANSNIEFFNLNAIAGKFQKEENKYKGLNEMKLSYNSIANEYIGEFNLIINNPMYSLYKGISSKK